MYVQKINDFIVRMGTTHHNKGHMLVFTTFVHIYIYILLGVNCTRSQWLEVCIYMMCISMHNTHVLISSSSVHVCSSVYIIYMYPVGFMKIFPFPRGLTALLRSKCAWSNITKTEYTAWLYTYRNFWSTRPIFEWSLQQFMWNQCLINFICIRGLTYITVLIAMLLNSTLHWPEAIDCR